MILKRVTTVPTIPPRRRLSILKITFSKSRERAHVALQCSEISELVLTTTLGPRLASYYGLILKLRLSTLLRTLSSPPPDPLISPLWAHLIAPLAGLLAALAFAPFEWRWAAPVGIALLFLLWLGATPWAAARLGFLFGLGYFGFGVSWIYHSIHEFGKAIASWALPLTVGFVALCAALPALSGWVAALLRSGRRPVDLLLLLPAAWLFGEWVRSWIFTGFPWLSLGHSQIDQPLAGVAPLLGTLGVSWGVTVTAALGLLIVLSAVDAARPTAQGERSAAPWQRVATPALALLSLALLSLALLWAGAWGVGQLRFTSPAGPAQQVAIIQGNVEQGEKMKPSQLLPTLRLYRDLTRANWDSDIVVWPETAVPTFLHRVDEGFLRPLAEEAAAQESDLLLGLFIYDFAGERYYNALMALTREGNERYLKRHLVPFGEYLPFRFLLDRIRHLVEVEMLDVTAGPSEQPLPRLGGIPTGLSICYEDAFASEIRRALPQAELLVNASDDAWFGDSFAPPQHLEIARMRALESGRYLVRATNTGISAIIDPQGGIVVRSAQFERDVLRGEIVPMRGVTPFVRWGDGVMLLLLALTTLILIVLRMRSARGGESAQA